MTWTVFTSVSLYTIDWGLKLWFLLYIPKKRSPNSAIAWLLLVFLVPTIGIVIFFILSNSKLSRSRQQKQSKINKKINKLAESLKKFHKVEVPKESKLSLIANLSESVGRLPVVPGNKTKILPEYNKTIKDITQQINLAKSDINIEYYIIALDETTLPLFAAIEKAILRGVKVRILIDAIGYRKFPKYRRLGKLLTQIEADWHLMLPLGLGRNYNRPDLRNHRKIVVIDNQVAYLGSQNLIQQDYHRSDGIYYDELVVKLTGPVVNECNAIFAGDWYAETGKILKPTLSPLKYQHLQTGKTLAQIVPSGPGYKYLGNLQLFNQLIHTAQKSVFITNPYFVPDESLLAACKSAALRGVNITILNSEVMDQPLVGNAQRSFYEELLDAGVKIFLYNKPTLLHSKHLTIDDEISVIGSSNMDIRSFALNLECVVILYDKTVVNSLRKVQQTNLTNSKQIHLNEWRSRRQRHKAFESIARLTSALQ